MSDYVPQPGDTQVREIIRIVPHAKLDDAVELFVDGLKFRIGTLFDAAKNLRWGQPDSLVAKDPAARQDVHFFVRTRVSEKTFTNDEGQEKHYIDIVAIWGADEEEPADDNIVSRKRGSGIRRANGAAAVPPLVEDDLRSRINGFADQMMSVLGRLHDHEQRLARLEGKPPGAALKVANEVLFGDQAGTAPAAQPPAESIPPGDDALFDERPAGAPLTHTLPDMATYAAAAEELIHETGNYAGLAAVVKAMYGAPGEEARRPFTAPEAEHMIHWLDTLVTPGTVEAMDRALGSPKARKNIIQATFEAAETFARLRNALREPAVAQAAANATWVWYLTPTGQTPPAGQPAQPRLGILRAHKNERIAGWWADQPPPSLARDLATLLAGCPRHDQRYIEAVMPVIWRALTQMALKSNAQGRDILLNQHNNIVKAYAAMILTDLQAPLI